ncbi:MAG: amino acid ABC transporter substrate-binding protein [Candidatus Competibacteraceae bacterium]|jgi:general L-amino acid transport system substrate-binding protein|nr:amino acid ABC transporter substrate-binding protein [Candidatus Competibacteraceae bacterium]
MKFTNRWMLFVILSMSWLLSSSVIASTLDDVKKRGAIQCGVSTGIPGFSMADDKGTWSGLDVDLCRAVAAAVFGDADKVTYLPLTAEERFKALQDGKIDILSRNTTWNMTRDTSMGISFAGINYFDGQGFMVRKVQGVRSALELNGVSVCVTKNTTTELNLKEYFTIHQMQYRPVYVETPEAARQAYEEKQCDVLTSDQSQLYAQRTLFSNPEDSMVLPEFISKEPLGPVVRQGDDQWLNIVKWSLFTLINAEEEGVSSLNVDRVKQNATNPMIRHLLGLEGNVAKHLGLSDDWAYQIIKQVGNYGESFERNVGLDSPLKMQRGQNALWTDGGLMYVPSVR